MSDSDNRKIFGVIVECAKLTPEIFVKAIEEMTKDLNKPPQGKTSLNKLMQTGKVDNIEVNDSNIGSFAQIAKKYNLTYALKRIQEESGKKQYLWILCTGLLRNIRTSRHTKRKHCSVRKRFLKSKCRPTKWRMSAAEPKRENIKSNVPQNSLRGEYFVSKILLVCSKLFKMLHNAPQSILYGYGV